MNEVRRRLEEQVEEGRRRDARMQQQNELLTHLLGRLNKARNEPPPLPYEQPRAVQAEQIRNMAKNPQVRAVNDQE